MVSRGVSTNVQLSANAKDSTADAHNNYGLLKFNQVPEWAQDNHFIISSYRPISHSYFGCLRSLGYLHNESVNIWTHALGAVLYPLLGLALYHLLKDRYATATHGDLIACGIFFLGAFLCLSLSATFHTVTNHSPEAHRFGNQLDYLGIVCMIAGSFTPSVYYGFYCDRDLQLLYWTIMGAVGLGCAAVSVRPKFRTPKWRPFRAAMFVGMGLSSVLSGIHGCAKYGVSQFNHQMQYEWGIYEGILYIAGAGLYAARVPERYSPGKYDVWGSSHQIFHILILCAAGTHLIGVIRAFDYTHQYASCLI